MLQPDNIYHLYNHANGEENLFREKRNYYFFLKKMKLYISPVASIYAYCLLPNHFHLLLRIKSEFDIMQAVPPDSRCKKLSDLEKFSLIEKKISKSFSNFFSCYTQSYNKVYGRKGSLFIPNFKSKMIENDLSFCKLVHYIHSNPVHHGFVKEISKWRFSSYNSLLSKKTTGLERDYVLTIFGGTEQFICYHKQPISRKES